MAAYIFDSSVKTNCIIANNVVDQSTNKFFATDGTIQTISEATWQPNTSTQEGYVASGRMQANKVWKTDANGNPAWRFDNYVGNGTLNITANSIVAGTFTANSSEDVDINIETGVVKIGNYYSYNALNIDYVLYAPNPWQYTSYTIAEMNSTYPDASVGSYGIYAVQYGNYNYPTYRLCTVNDEGTWVDVGDDDSFYTTNGSVIYKENYYTTTNNPIIGKATYCTGYGSDKWLYDIRYVSQYDIYTLNNQKKQVMNDDGKYIYIDACELDLSDFEFEKGVIYLNVYTSAPYVWDHSSLVSLLNGDITNNGVSIKDSDGNVNINSVTNFSDSNKLITETELATKIDIPDSTTPYAVPIFTDDGNGIEDSGSLIQTSLSDIYGVLPLYDSSSYGTIVGYAKIQYQGTAQVPYLLRKGMKIYADESLNQYIGYASSDGFAYSTGSYTTALIDISGSQVPVYWNYSQCLNVVFQNKGNLITGNAVLDFYEPIRNNLYQKIGLSADGNFYYNFSFDSLADGVYSYYTVGETTLNKVTSISASSTDDEYPTAKCMYDIVGNIESVLENIIGE